MGRIFGTDGVRGVAGVELTAQLALDLAVAAVPVLAPVATVSGHRRRPVAVIGRDSRASGDFLEAAVVAGLASSGVDVLRLGVIPTPGVAYLTGALDADFGVVLSASHNPAADNGIKFFGRAGVKLPDETEDAIEARLFSPGGATPRTPRVSQQASPMARTAIVSDPSAGTERPWVNTHGFGRVTDAYSAHETYLDHLLASLPIGVGGQPPLQGLRVVVDCAHGAAYSLGPRALRRAGAEVIAIGAAPDGENINAGVGSTHMDTLAAAVIEHGADAGLAFDGDADRCLAIDGDGQPLDGDQILTVLAAQLKRSNQLTGDTVVVTVMSNLGFHDAAALIDTLVDARAAGRDWSSPRVLKRYERARRADVLDMLAVTDGLYRAFRVPLPALAPLRGLGFAAVNAAAPLRRELVRRAIGVR